MSTLLTPGPVPLHKTTREILAQPVVHHRTPKFEQSFGKILKHLKTLFRCEDGHVFTLSSSGSGGMEASMVNLLSPGDAILVVVSGKFGDRWAQMGRSFGYEVDTLDVTWGESVALEELTTRCQQKSYKAVFSQACETSTGVLHPIDRMREAIGEKPLLVIDGITAVGALDIPMTQWGIDGLVGGSQKAFALPTGMSFLGLSKRALDAMDQSKTPKFYFDLKPEYRSNQKNQTRFSSMTTLMFALEHVLDQMIENGLDHHYVRVKILAENTRKAFELLGMKVFPQTPSPSLTAISTGSINSTQLRAQLEKEFEVIVMDGQDQLKGQLIRIGHMGAIDNKDMLELFSALITALDLDSSVQKQIEDLFR